MLRSLLICPLTLWLAFGTAQALDPSKRLTQYAHTSWRIQDGYFPNTPFWISQTKDGYLWVGGNSGALRFDGVRFTPWSVPIASTPVLHPLSLRAGDFWIAARTEIAHIKDNVRISHYDLPGIDAIYKDSDGSMWVLSYLNPDRALCHATDASIRCFGRAEGITIHGLASFIPDGKGGFWIGGDTSLLHWRMGAAPEVYSPKQLQSNTGQIGIHALLVDSDGSLLVGIMAAGSGRGLERFRDGVLTPVVLPKFDGSELAINAIIKDSDKNLWIATYGNGIYRIHGQTVDHFGRADGLSSDAVSDLYEGDDGIVWAATSDGIDNFRDLPVITYTTAEGLGRDGANSVMATTDGTVWVGNFGTLDFIRNGMVTSVRAPGQQVGSLLEDHRGNIWVGVDDGLFIFKDGRFRSIPGPDHHPVGLVVGITEDIDGNIWAECVGDHRKLVRIRDFEVREEFSKAQVPAAHDIAADPKGGIWLGSLTGDLTFFRDGRARTFPLKLKSQTWAYQIAVDPEGSVITATDDGLVVLHDGTVQRLNKENGLPCEGVYGFAADDNKNLWLNTPCGYIEVAAADVRRWSVHPDTIVQPRVFDMLDGALPGRVSFNPAAKTRDGRLWFVNNLSLQRIDPSHLASNGTVSPVYVESLVADRKQFPPQEGLRLPALTRDLQIGYTSPSFLIPQKVKFRYRLDGHDRDWQEADTRREAFYTGLGPGKYRFRVIACSSNGVWNEAGPTLDFTIAPAFYQTVWFRALGVFLFLAILAALYRFRLRHLERQRDALRKSEKELRDVIDTIPAIVWTTLPDGSSAYLNRRFIEYSGLSTEQTTESGWKAAVHPDDLKRQVSKWMDAIAAGKPLETEVRLRCSDGQYRWHLDRGVPLRDEDGHIVKWYGVATDIEDRKRAAGALQQSQFYLVEGQRLAHMGSWAFNPSGFFEYWSPELFTIYGLDPLKGAPTLEEYLATLHPQDRDSMAETIQTMHAERCGCDVKKRIVRGGGELRYIRCVGIPVVEGEVLKGFLGTAIDITEQELLTRELERQQAHLTEAQRLTRMGSWTINVRTDEHFWSDEIFRIYEFDQKVKPSWPLIRDRVHPDDRASLDRRRKMEFTQTGWSDSEADLRIVLPDGRIKHLHTIAHPVMDTSGQIVEVIGTTMDVTDRKQIEDSLRRSERHLAEAQKLTHTGSWAWRIPDRNAVEVSDEWCRIYGFDPAEEAPTWEKLCQRIHPEDRLKWTSQIEQAIVEKADYDLEFRIVLPNGMVKWIHAVGQPVLSEAGDLEQFVGSSTDITELKSAEHEHEKLRQLEADMAHIDRVSTLGEMAASLAHEIKQPIAAAITSANSCVEWLAHEPPNLDRARAAAARIDKYGNRAAEIIDRMRSFYRKSPPHRELVDVNGIVYEMLPLLKGEATRCSITMRTELSGELPKIMVDRVQLQQVFMNLMLNGIEAMGNSGGELTVKSQLHDGHLHFSVDDTGVGLPTEKLDQIFSAFFTTKPQGSGMGLAISRSIVESHGGRLWASTNAGGGATFHFTLPVQVTESSPVVA